MKFIRSFFIIVIILASFLVVECRASCSRCPFEWTEYNSQCYRPFLQSFGYDEAKEHCQSQTQGAAPGQLLKIDSLNEMVFIMEYVDTILGNETVDYIWLTEDISLKKERNNLIFSSALGESDGHNHCKTSCPVSTPAVDVNVDMGTFQMIDSPDFVDSSCAVYIDGGAFVDLGEFAGTCVSDPDVCTSEIVSWSIWLKLNSKDLASNNKYYLSIGGETSGAHGIVMLYQNSLLRFGARSFKRLLNGYFGLDPDTQVLMDTWFHFAATIDLTQTEKTDIVKIYLNGEKVIPTSSSTGTHNGAGDGRTKLFLGRVSQVVGATSMWGSAAYSSLSVFDGLLSEAEIRNIYACGSIDWDLKIRSLFANRTNTLQDVHRYECRASGTTAQSPDIAWRVYYKEGYWKNFSSSSVDGDVHVTVSTVSPCIVESVLVIKTSHWAGSVGDIISCTASLGASNASVSIYQGKNRTIGYADNDNMGFLFTGNGMNFRHVNRTFTEDEKFPFICKKDSRF